RRTGVAALGDPGAPRGAGGELLGYRDPDVRNGRRQPGLARRHRAQPGGAARRLGSPPGSRLARACALNATRATRSRIARALERARLPAARAGARGAAAPPRLGGCGEGARARVDRLGPPTPAPERLFGFPSAATPDASWPPLADRVAQLAPLTGHGWRDVPLNLARWIGWAGDQGVQLFLIVGGFALTWGLLNAGAPTRLALADFWRWRAARIFPLWCAAHLLFLAPCLVLGRGLDPGERAFWLDLLAVRASPYQLYYLAPAWWFVGLV